MPRPRNAVPTPRHHKGRAVLDVYENGLRRTRTLGAWGSPEADAEYKRFLAEFATGTLDRPTGPDVTVNEMLLAFTKHAEQHFRRPDGTTTHELTEYKLVIKVVRELYGHTRGRCTSPRGEIVPADRPPDETPDRKKSWGPDSRGDDGDGRPLPVSARRRFKSDDRPHELRG